jgi:hypothetical protein
VKSLVFLVTILSFKRNTDRGRFTTEEAEIEQRGGFGGQAGLIATN